MNTMPIINKTDSSRLSENGSSDVMTSVYIPRVYGNIPVEFISETFERLGLGVVDNIQKVNRPGNAYMAFVYFKSWNIENPAAINLAKKVNDPNAQARIVYDDPWYWIILPNTSKSKTQENDDENQEFIEEFKLTTDEEIDLLNLMVEDLQDRLMESERKQKELAREVTSLRSILLGDEPVPPPPVLVRQNAIAIDVPIQNEEPLGRSRFLREHIPEKAPALPPTPFVVTPFHFHSKTPVDEILERMTVVFAKNNIVVKEFRAHQCRFTLSSNEDLRFVVKVFTEGEYNLVEFQQRDGDRDEFFNTFEKVTNELSDIIDFTAPRSIQSYHQCQIRKKLATPVSSTAIAIDGYMRNAIAKHIAEGNPDMLPTFEDVDWFPTEQEIAEYREDRFQRRLDEADIPPTPAMIERQTTQWWPTDEEIKNYPQYCEKRFRANSILTTTFIAEKDNEQHQMMVDNMGLVYSNDDKNFWCDP